MNYDKLNELSIFALRELARRTGVYSPTSKKKGELINEILEIMEGKKEPYLPKTRQGRPPKDYGYSFAEALNPSISRQQPSYQTPILAQNLPTFKYDTDGLICGYVENISPVSACLWIRDNLNFNCIYIPNSIINTFKLKTGDFIHAHLEQEDGQTIVGSVSNINNCPVKKYDKDTRLNYHEIKHILPTKPLDFSKNDLNALGLKKGESIYLYGLNNNNNTKMIINLLNSTEKTKKIYISTVLAEKNVIFLDELDDSVEKFTSTITDTAETAQHIVNLGIERAKRMFERGDDVVVAIDDVKSIMSVDNGEFNVTKNAMSATKNGLNGGSLTLFAIMPNDNSAGLFEKLADHKLSVSGDKFTLLD